MPSCPQCRTAFRDGNVKCCVCGTDLRKGDDDAEHGGGKAKSGQIHPQPKSVAGVILLNFFMPGTGQLYLGQTGKFLLIMLFGFLLFFFALRLPSEAVYGAVQIFSYALYLAALIDGVLIAVKMNQNKSVGKWECF